MRYTVKKLSKISGVSVRTLHWYDQTGLLKPAFYGANGYRYYEEKQLLLLQQILFFRELGFSLGDIQKLLEQDDFDKIKALIAHREILEQEIDRKKELLKTIDKTILHLKGKQTMSDKELFKGFDPERQKEYEQYIVKSLGKPAEQLLEKSKRTTAKWDKDEWDDVKAKGDAIHKALAEAIDQDLSPESDEVQTIIHHHYQLIKRFYHPTKDLYIGLTQLYVDHPDFKKFFEHSLLDILKRLFFYSRGN